MTSRKAFPSSFALAALRRIPLLLLSAILSALVLLSCPRIAEAKYASMVIDADTGEVFHAVNADARNYPASLTKMMTLYILFDHLNSGKVKLSDRITISAYAAKQQPSKLGLRPGQTISVEDAILALCIKSANDIAVAVGEHLSGTESAFAQA
ncbi:MAG: serine hydrolase, partial [Rhodospirillaceae bacterium]|nr:serine hydrolase [Rhodospirillaceae bacterium]